MEVPCTNCDQPLEIPAELCGQPIQCPTCDETFTAPIDTAAPSEPEQPASSAGLSLQPSTKQYSPEANSAEDLLVNLSDTVSGPPRPQRSERDYTNSGKVLKETAASRFSASSTTTIVIVLIVVAFLYKQGIFSVNDLFKGEIVKTHERAHDIEAEMVEKLEAAESLEEGAEAVSNTVVELKKIKLDNLNEQYKAAFQDYIRALQKWSTAMKRSDLEKIEEFNDLRIDEARRLNEIYEEQPEVVTPLRF